MHNPDVIVIGAGAAGLMCALTAAKRGRRIQVIERANKPGKKILMSGGGRCNFTNLYIEADRYLSQNPAFCRSALARYTQWDFISLVDAHGIAWHEKELGQLFCDGSSKLILKMLLDECADAGVQIQLDCEISQVDKTDSGFHLETSHGVWNCESLVVASGGLSIPKMGASGFGFELARQFGHNLHPSRAGLVPLTLSGRPLEQLTPLAGLAHTARASVGNHSFTQPVLFTHRGISGPAILQISSYWETGDMLELDLLPNIKATSWLIAAKQQNPARSIEQQLATKLPRNLARQLVEIFGWNAPLQNYKTTALEAIGQQLNQWTLRPSGTEGYRTAEVTLGGVDTTELSSRDLQSIHVPSLYFIGEVVDVTGHLGGFNFQWAWSSGHACGEVC